MKSLEKRPSPFPIGLVLSLPFLGLIQKIPELLGWVDMGTNSHFFLLLMAPVTWTMVAIHKIEQPFIPLLLVGGLYGVLMAISDLIYWIVMREPLGLPETGWSFDDLMMAINAFLIPSMQVIGNLLLGLVIGALTGLIAKNRIRHRLYKNGKKGKS